jgi:hypothetical protein
MPSGPIPPWGPSSTAWALAGAIAPSGGRARTGTQPHRLRLSQRRRERPPRSQHTARRRPKTAGNDVGGRTGRREEARRTAAGAAGGRPRPGRRSPRRRGRGAQMACGAGYPMAFVEKRSPEWATPGRRGKNAAREDDDRPRSTQDRGCGPPGPRPAPLAGDPRACRSDHWSSSLAGARAPMGDAQSWVDLLFAHWKVFA